MQMICCLLGVMQTNCYIITNEKTKESIVIDPGEQAHVIEKQIEEHGLIPVAILLTHGHFDHIMAAEDISKRFSIPIYALEEEKQLLADAKLNCSSLVSKNIVLKADVLINDKDILNIAGMNIQVIYTPGHTMGGGCYYFSDEATLFSGDTLFHEAVGRTDLPTGDPRLLIESIEQKLLILPDEVKVYPGHGESTTIGHEKNNNPFLNDEAFWG